MSCEETGCVQPRGKKSSESRIWSLSGSVRRLLERQTQVHQSGVCWKDKRQKVKGGMRCSGWKYGKGWGFVVVGFFHHKDSQAIEEITLGGCSPSILGC